MFNQPCNQNSTTTLSCKQYFYCASDQFCYHQAIFPLQLYKIIGIICMAICGGLSSSGGLGGGGIMLPFLTLCFHFMPKQSTIVIFACVLGANFGNLIQHVKYNKQLIRTRIGFLVGPGTVAGTLFGVFINITFPAIFIIGIILITSTIQIKKVYNKATVLYQNQKQMRLQESYQPLNLEDNFQPRFLWFNIGIFILGFILLNIKGSKLFPSWLSIQYCSSLYWIFYTFTFILFIVLSLYISYSDTKYSENYHIISQYSFLSGIYAGFGLGGGLFLIRMCQQMKLSPLESSCTVSLCIFMTALMNSFQAIMVGALTISQFLQFFVLIGLGSFLVSRTVNKYIKKYNRYSYLLFLLVIISALATILIPFSSFQKWIMSDYDNSILFFFKDLC